MDDSIKKTEYSPGFLAEEDIRRGDAIEIDFSCSRVRRSRPMTDEEKRVSSEYRAKIAKEPVKVRLARKYIQANCDGYGDDHLKAYLAGFERAKALCVDSVQRFCDEFVPKRDGKNVSELVAVVGELP